MSNGLMDSVGTRGIFSTATLAALTLYAGKKCLDGIVDVVTLATRVAQFVRAEAGVVYSMPGFAKGWEETQKNFWQIHQPTKMVNVAEPNQKSEIKEVEAGEKSTELMLSAVKNIVLGVLLFDARLVLAGPLPKLYNDVLNFTGPFRVDTSWRGPITWAMTKYFPDAYKCVRQLDFKI